MTAIQTMGEWSRLVYLPLRLPTRKDKRCLLSCDSPDKDKNGKGVGQEGILIFLPLDPHPTVLTHPDN